MKADIKALCDCDGIFFLCNWKGSKGAKIEHEIAQHLGLEMLYETVPIDVPTVQVSDTTTDAINSKAD